MIYTEHPDAESFLTIAQSALERHESANGLILGIALRLVHEPLAYGSPPFLATVVSDAGLQVAALMTPPYKLQIHAEDDHDSAGLALVAEALSRGKWPVPGVLARQAVAEGFASIWHGKTGAACQPGMRERIYELRRVVPPQFPAGEFRPASVEEIELVRQWARGFHEECFGDDHYERDEAGAEEKVRSGSLYLWVDGVPTSMAGRGRPTPHGEAVGPVYTPPSHRRRGYATALVARVSQEILEGGRQFCTLYADLSNRTSNSIYRKIGYAAVADVVDMLFEGGSARPA